MQSEAAAALPPKASHNPDNRPTVAAPGRWLAQGTTSQRCPVSTHGTVGTVRGRELRLKLNVEATAPRVWDAAGTLRLLFAPEKSSALNRTACRVVQRTKSGEHCGTTCGGPKHPEGISYRSEELAGRSLRTPAYPWLRYRRVRPVRAESFDYADDRQHAYNHGETLQEGDGTWEPPT